MKGRTEYMASFMKNVRMPIACFESLFPVRKQSIENICVDADETGSEDEKNSITNDGQLKSNEAVNITNYK